MNEQAAPYHAHIYYAAGERDSAAALRDAFMAQAGDGERSILFVGRMMDAPVGPHPIAQYEIHFREGALEDVMERIRRSGLRALVHPLTQDDVADHTSLGNWIGEPVDLDLGVLDPPGQNQGIPRFGKTDF